MGWWSFALIFSLYFFCGACKEIGKCFPHSMLLLLTFVCLSLLLLFCFAFTCSRNRRHIWFYLHGFLLHLNTCYGISLPKIWQYRNPSKNRGYTWAHVEFLKVFRQKCQAHNLKVVGSNPTLATISHPFCNCRVLRKSCPLNHQDPTNTSFFLDGGFLLLKFKETLNK